MPTPFRAGVDSRTLPFSFDGTWINSRKRKNNSSRAAGRADLVAQMVELQGQIQELSNEKRELEFRARDFEDQLEWNEALTFVDDVY